MFTKNLIGLSMAGVLIAGTAVAQTTATAAADLNLRMGPGPNFKIIDVIAGGDETVVDGCLTESNWCKVTYDGNEGWAFGNYLAIPLEGEPVALAANREVVEVKTVTYDSNEQAITAGTLGTMGGMAGAAIVGGPLAIAVGVLAGSVAGAATTPPNDTQITYVSSNPVEPVFVQGEVVVGAQIPEVVTVYPVPDSEYSYANLNGNYVYVTPQDRKIVYIMR